MSELPVLPYPDRDRGSSSGHSGSDTSQRLAENADASGETKGQQASALRLLATLGEHGITWTELLSELWISGYPNAHHGAASRTLSNLHRAGLICRLAETRHDRKIYVLPSHVGDRETELPRDARPRADRLPPTPLEREAVSLLAEEVRLVGALGWVTIRAQHAQALLALIGRLRGNPT
jgi:hypothetical protein